MTYTGVSFRAGEKKPDTIEIGVFHFDECAEVITIPTHEARAYVKALNLAIRESVGSWSACPECGCTDVQDQVWLELNTEEPMDSCESYMWCPQCAAGDGETFGADGEIHTLDFVDAPKPYKDPEPEPEQPGLWDWLIKWPGEECKP